MNTKTSPENVTEDPQMEATYYGVPVAYVGEDGEMLALGHHSPRRVLAAFNAHARRFYGLVNLADDRNATAAAWLADLQPQWAVFRVSVSPESDCAWFSDEAAEGAPGALPVTFLPSI
ncbi:hypothetical protein ACH4N4_30735 [Streptomyces microflavus]|uniref:hypothetical protein n=1 Tax=Streptomyces microflavus TaxID=1919 RepID=UPI00378FA566